MSAEEYRRKHDLVVTGDNAPDPIQDFQSAGFTPDILEEVSDLGVHLLGLFCSPLFTFQDRPFSRTPSLQALFSFCLTCSALRALTGPDRAHLLITPLGRLFSVLGIYVEGGE